LPGRGYSLDAVSELYPTYLKIELASTAAMGW
jgi:hypothetical protein